MQAPALSNFNGQRAFNAPVGSASSGDAPHGQPCLPCPFCLTQGLTKSSQISISSFVLLLFHVCRPSHIANLIMPVHVYSFNRMLRRGFSSYMCKELWVRIKSKLNATPAVLVITGSTQSVTSFFSTMVSKVFSGFLTLCRFSVDRLVGGGRFFLQARARLLMTCCKVRRPDGHGVTAIAQTVPKHTLFRPCITDDEQSPKALPRQNADTFFSRTVRIYSKIVSSHDVFSLLENVKVRVVGSCNFFRPAYYSTA
jgi:hypothetical protein